MFNLSAKPVGSPFKNGLRICPYFFLLSSKLLPPPLAWLVLLMRLLLPLSILYVSFFHAAGWNDPLKWKSNYVILLKALWWLSIPLQGSPRVPRMTVRPHQVCPQHFPPCSPSTLLVTLLWAHWSSHCSLNSLSPVPPPSLCPGCFPQVSAQMNLIEQALPQ